MKHFIYTYSEKTPRNGYTVKTVSIWRIVRNEPRHVITCSDIFVDKDQLVMDGLEKAKCLPRACFERSEVHNGRIHMTWNLKALGIATVTQI